MTITRCDGYTLKTLPPVTLGSTTYAVKVQAYDLHPPIVWLTGPRGGEYFLRDFIYRNGQHDNGLCQVVSVKSGAPLHVRGNKVRVYFLSDVIEIATPSTGEQARA